jgi:hypothetical protein
MQENRRENYSAVAVVLHLSMPYFQKAAGRHESLPSILMNLLQYAFQISVIGTSLRTISHESLPEGLIFPTFDCFYITKVTM